MNHHPDWTLLDPETPPGLDDLEGSGRVVGIVATDAAQRGGWGITTAVAAADAWSRAGVRLILADGALSTPRLHEAVGIENGEGVADALIFGASVRRVARRVEGSGYFAVAAGTAVADAAEAMSGGRWSHLCAAFRDAGVTLAVYLDAGDPATAIALGEASHILVVAAEDEELPPVVVESGAQVVGVVGVAGATAADGSVMDEAGEAELPAFFDEGAPAAADPGPLDATVSLDAAMELEPDVPVGPEAPAEPDPFAESAAVVEEGPLEMETIPEAPEEGIDVDMGDEPRTDVPDAAPPAEAMDDATEAPAASEVTSEEADGQDDSGPEEGASDEDSEAVIFQRALAAAEAEGVAPLDEILEETEGVARKGGSRNVLLLILLLVILGALVAGWLGYIEIPGITPTGAAASALAFARLQPDGGADADRLSQRKGRLP